jgi:beta-galactosidase/beta-glucuronidase
MMKAEKKTETRVSKAIAEAWQGSTTAKQAAEKYVAMLKEDQALRDEATEVWLERIAYQDVVKYPRAYRSAFKNSAQKLRVLQKGETATPSVDLTGVVSIYAQDMFERFRLPISGVPLGDATREDLENAISHEGSRSTHHAQQKVFYEKMQKRLSGNAQVVREVWTTEEAARAYDEALA